jgi:hypothetical protein
VTGQSEAMVLVKGFGPPRWVWAGVGERCISAQVALHLQSCSLGSRGEFQLNRAVQDVKG